MAGGPPGFTRERLHALLALLNEELQKGGVSGEVCIVGGAAMILAFGNRDSTEDIDALLLMPASVRKAIERVAHANGLPAGWLNDGAKGFASNVPSEVVEILALSNLRVVSPAPEYILAMKCIAARTGLDKADKADTKFLIQHLGLQDSGKVLAAVEKYYPKSRIPAKTQYFIQEICDELNQPPKNDQ